MNLYDLYISVILDDKASSGMESISAGMIAKAELIASSVKGIFDRISDAAVGAVTSSVNAFGEYEQMVGGMEAIFKESSDMVIENAKRAYETAGMSANQYMNNITGLATRLIRSVSQRGSSSSSVDTSSAEEAAEAQQKALDEQYTQMQRSLSDQLDAQREAYSEELSNQRKAYSSQLKALQKQKQKEYDAQKSAYAKEYKALQEKLANELEERRESNANALSQLKERLSAEYDAVKASQDAEVEAYKEATEQRIKEINREYAEKLKLVDEEEYRRVQAIDNQIDAINEQTESERNAIKKRQQQEKIAQLEYESTYSTVAKDRREAAKELQEYLAQVAQEEREAERKIQLQKLKDQRQSVKDEASARRAALKTEQKETIAVYKEQRADELKEIKNSNKLKLAELKKHQNEQIEQLRKAQKLEMKEIQKKNSLILEAQKERQEQELAMLKEAQDSEVEAVRDGQERSLEEMSKGQQRALKQMQRAQQDQLSSLKSSISSQKKALKESIDDTEGYVEASAEDIEKAAKLADTAMTDMADNHNRFGTSIEELEAAYNSLSRGSARMLDNLRLGYGEGSKELERMLQDAEAIKAKQGEVVSYSKDNFADIVEAIHVIQVNLGISGLTYDEVAEKIKNMSFTEEEMAKISQDLGISYQEVMDKIKSGTFEVSDASVLMGTTMQESHDTLQGSLSRLQGAWENWLISLADDEYDVGETTQALMESIGEYAGLLLPRVTTILETVFSYIKEHAPEMAETLKNAFLDSLPEEWKEKFQGMVDAITGFLDHIPEIADAIKGLAAAFAGLEVIGKIGSMVLHAVEAFSMLTGEGGLLSLAPAAETAGGAMTGLSGATEGLAAALAGPVGLIIAIAATVAGVVAYIAKNEEAREKVLGVAQALGGDLMNALTLVTDTLSPLTGLVDIFIETVGRLFMTMIENLTNIFGPLYERAKAILGPAIETLGGALKNALSALVNLIGFLADGFTKLLDAVYPILKPLGEFLGMIGAPILSALGAVIEAVGVIVQAFADFVQMLVNVGTRIEETTGFFQKIKDVISNVADGIGGFFRGIGDAAQNVFNSVSEWFGKIPEAIGNVFNGAGDWLTTAGENIINGFFNGLHAAWDRACGWFGGIGQWIADHKGPKQYDLNLLVPAGGWIMEGLQNGLQKSFESDVVPYVSSMAGKMEDAFGMPTLAAGARQRSAGFYARQGDENKSLTVILELDRTQFAKAVYQLNNDETQRVGTQLVGGIA